MREERNDGGSRYDRQKPRKKGSAFVTFLGTLILVIAIGVFGYAAYTLYGYYKEYKVGTDEYGDLKDKFTDLTGNGSNSGNENGGSAAESNIVSAESGSSVWIGDDGSTVVFEPDGNYTVIGEEGATVEYWDDGSVILVHAKDDEETKLYPVDVNSEVEGTVKIGPALQAEDLEILEDQNKREEVIENAGTLIKSEDGRKKALPMLKNPIDFAKLHEINEDIIGWIRIRGVDASYPITQGEDNDFYLHRTFEKVDNFAGCIFLNCTNSRFFTDQNSIVYGHNMKNGSMFGSLSKFKNQETYDKCPYFWIFGPDLIYQYRIFSCAEVSKIGDPYRIRFTTEEYENFLKHCQEVSLINNGGMTLDAKDRIVTLSTCTGNDATRFIVQGKLVQIFAAK